MIRKLLLALATLIVTMGFAFAQVDVNKADQAALDGIKGIGPAKSKAIIDERKRGGNFKDWDDFEKRVKGIGDKNSSTLSQAGLTVNGQSKPNAPAKKDAKDKKSDAQKDTKEAKKDAKSDSQKDVKDTKKDAKKDSKSESQADTKDAKKSASDAQKDSKAEAKDAKKDAKPEAKK